MARLEDRGGTPRPGSIRRSRRPSSESTTRNTRAARRARGHDTNTRCTGSALLEFPRLEMTPERWQKLKALFSGALAESAAAGRRPSVPFRVDEDLAAELRVRLDEHARTD